MFCRKCGKEIPDDSAFCQYCGTSLSGEQKPKQEGFILTIDRKSQVYLINPPIKVSIDDSIRISVDNGKTETITLSPGIHTIEMKGSGRSKTVEIDLKKNTVMEIGFSRLSGAIIAEIK